MRILYDGENKRARVVISAGYDAGKTYIRRYDEASCPAPAHPHAPAAILRSTQSARCYADRKRST